MTDFAGLLQCLEKEGAKFIIIGEVAAAAHGSTRVTVAIDLVYQRSTENIRKVVAAMAGVHPYLRGAPPGLRFRFDEETVKRGLNFTLTTTLGSIDVLGEVVGGGGYEDLLAHTVELCISRRNHRCLDLDTLIQVKRAAGRPKDFETIAELEAIREELGTN